MFLNPGISELYRENSPNFFIGLRTLKPTRTQMLNRIPIWNGLSVRADQGEKWSYDHIHTSLLWKSENSYNELDSFGSSKIGDHLLKNIFVFLNNIVFRYFDYPVIFPYLLAASNLMLAVKTWLTKVVITKRLTVLLPGKVNVPENCLHATAQTFIWSHNFSKTCTYYTYWFVYNLPLTNI